MNTKVERLSLSPESRPAGKLEQLRIRIAGRLRLGLYRKSARYGLRRDLAFPFERPQAKIPLAVRRASASDVDAVLRLDDPRNNELDRLQVAWRRALAAKNMKGCFVAVDQRDNTPCYIHWIFGAGDNSFLQQYGGLPVLAPHQALMEDAYTPPNYRGLGIMSAAMAEIAEQGAALGASEVITFVDMDNIASLKGCQRAGFNPHLLHHRSQMAFGVIHRDEFVPLSADDPRRTQKF